MPIDDRTGAECCLRFFDDEDALATDAADDDMECISLVVVGLMSVVCEW